MKVQFPVRWTDKKKLDRDEDLTRRALQESPEEEVVEVEYTYGNAVIDTKDIRTYNNLDDEHCIVRTYFNDSYCVVIPFEDLKNIMVELTGEQITIIRKVVQSPIKKVPKKPKPPKSDEDDLIL